ncbi:hypothetical protein FB45DRAFT_1056513 [Roridomyces roridus]|uniref:DUF7702 domain-containing protein n=1 Tax=Roridomyces roridus TaxID=1738132 RepID=A0AAD7BYM3_9AGAR|nr:hypothetical protein FB45DRAFT_1056513 [Roridomyces roridus]
MANTNYNDVLGIKNKWAPILFAVLYSGLMLWYLVQTFRRRQWVFIGLAFFSTLRVISFSLRSAMANNHHNSAFNRRMAVAYVILYNVGFFSVLLSAYRLLHDRRRLAKIDSARGKSSHAIHRVVGHLHKGRFMEVLLLVAIIVTGVGAGYVFGTDTGRTRLGNRLTEAGVYLFLVVTIVIVILTFLLIHIERSLEGKSGAPARSWNHHLILLVVAAMLFMRVVFFAATVRQRASGKQTPTAMVGNAVQNNEHFWYPLAALTELLVVLLLLIPGLSPVREALKRHVPGVGDSEKRGEAGQHSNGTAQNMV